MPRFDLLFDSDADKDHRADDDRADDRGAARPHGRIFRYFLKNWKYIKPKQCICVYEITKFLANLKY